MYKLLNRFAWVISIIIALQFSFFIDNDGPFDDEGFLTFIIVLAIVKFFILGGWYIKSRLDFFAKSLNENYINKENKIETLEEEKIKTEEVNGKEDLITQMQNEEFIRKYEAEKETKKQIEIKEQKVYKEEVKESKKEEPSKVAVYIKSFFAENLLAKLGGIFVFLGVLFLLALVYNNIGPVGKIIIGFSIGISIFISGVLLDKKGLQNEGRILLGIGILINYLVILSGRYLIGDNINNNLLSVGTTFLLLILNTVFAVVTSLVYKSRTLLLFSFIFAYLNPIIVGGSSDNPYTLLGYTLIVSVGGLILSLKDKNIILNSLIFLLANILILLGTVNNEVQFISVLLSSAIISLSSIFVIYKLEKQSIVYFLGGAYLFLSLIILTGDNMVNNFYSYFSYMLSIVIFFIIGIYLFLKTAINSILYILILPILIISGITITGLNFSIPFSLLIISLLYLFALNYIKSNTGNIIKYILISLLGLFIFLNSSLLSLEKTYLDSSSLAITLLVIFIFIFSSYTLSRKKDLGYLYSIGTIIGAISLAPLLSYDITNDISGVANILVNSDYIKKDFSIIILSIISVIIFSLSNWLIPFINKNLLSEKSDIKNIIIGLVVGLIFIGYQLFNLSKEYFPGTLSLGIEFTALAIIYFVMSYIMLNKIGIQKIKKDENSKNIFYSYIGITISLLTLSIALVFSKYDVVVSSIWLFEASILFYFFNKLKEYKIYIAAILVFFIGVVKLGLLIDVVNTKDFLFLIPFSLIAISLILNLKFLQFIEKNIEKVFHDMIHIISIIILAILLLIIIPNTGLGWSILGISIFIAISSIIYSYFDSKLLKYFFLVGFTGFTILHIGSFDYIDRKLARSDLEYLVVLQYLSTLIIGVGTYFYNKINKSKIGNSWINMVLAIYLLIITSIYIYDLFDTTFAITIYWGVASSIILMQGISRNLKKLRTIGLYFITLTAGKIFLYDIWYGIDDAISRVVALIVIGILFILLSTKYTKKYGNNIAGEFNLENLKSEEDINTKIEKINIEDIKSVKFIFEDNTINIRAINLMKIVIYIINKYNGKTVFEKDELKSDFEYIKQNFKSDLPKASYEKIVSIMKYFVKNGGEVEIIKK